MPKPHANPGYQAYDVNTGSHDLRPIPDVTGWVPERAYIRGHMHGHQDGTQAGTEAERARIVAWLRAVATAVDRPQNGDARDMSVFTLREMSDAIERGDQ